MNRLNEILTYKSLAFKHAADNSQLVDYIVETQPEAVQAVTKNVCAHLPIPLVERLENSLAILNMSKREFIQAAIIDALDRFDKIADEYNIFEAYEDGALTAEVTDAKKIGPEAA